MPRPNIIIIPSTNNFTIVFPSNSSSVTFDSTSYSPFLTDGRAQLEEINQVLREIENTKKPFTSKVNKIICAFVATLFIAFSCFIPMLVSVMQAGARLRSAIGLIGFIMLILTIIGICLKEIQRINKEERKACQEIVKKVNQDFSGRGLRWHLPLYFPKWVELWKDYIIHARGQENAQSISLHQVNQQLCEDSEGSNEMNRAQLQYQNKHYLSYQNNNGYNPPSQFEFNVQI